MPEVQDNFAMRKILEVKQRIQTIVVYEELAPQQDGTEVTKRKEVITDTYDRPLQAQYT